MNPDSRLCRRAVLTAGLALAVLLGLGPPFASAAIWEVQMTDSLRFDPAAITVAVGDTVRWVNVSVDEPHTATADSARARRAGFNSGSFPAAWLDPGESFEFTFTQAGQFPYHCIPHEAVGMVGSVTVNAPATTPAHFVTATAEDGGVFVRWKVAARSDRAGFHVLRSTGWGHEFVRVNHALIPVDASPEAEHAFFDTTVVPGTRYHYIVEDVGTAGMSSLWGPALISTHP